MPADRIQHSSHSNQIHQNYLSQPTSSSNRQESIESYHHQTILPGPFDHQIIPSNLKSKPKRLVSRPLQRNQACSTCRSRKVNSQSALD